MAQNILEAYFTVAMGAPNDNIIQENDNEIFDNQKCCFIEWQLIIRQ